MTDLEKALVEELSAFVGVDGAYVGPDGSEALTVFVLAHDHGIVQRGPLLDLEDRLSERFGRDITFAVRAHQGRSLEALSDSLLFARG